MEDLYHKMGNNFKLTHFVSLQIKILYRAFLNADRCWIFSYCPVWGKFSPKRVGALLWFTEFPLKICFQKYWRSCYLQNAKIIVFKENPFFHLKMVVLLRVFQMKMSLTESFSNENESYLLFCFHYVSWFSCRSWTWNKILLQVWG